MDLTVQVAEEPAGVPALGLADVTMLPAISTATHNEADGHETPSMALMLGTFLTCHAVAPPDGFVDVATLP